MGSKIEQFKIFLNGKDVRVLADGRAGQRVAPEVLATGHRSGRNGLSETVQPAPAAGHPQHPHPGRGRAQQPVPGF